ncbi:MAG: hypothetical protein WCJ11_04660 [Methylococcaceae bacterium]
MTKNVIENFLNNEEGLTMVEYAIGAAIIAGVAISVFTALGDALASLVGSIVTTLDSSGGTGGA